MIAVTGAAGLVGTACLRALADRGEEFVAIDRRAGSFAARWRTADLRSARAARRALRDATHVIHLAGHTSPAAADRDTLVRENVAIAANVLGSLEDAGRAAGATAVLASSTCVYGFAYEPRVRSPLYLPVDEDHPRGPGDAYSLSKVMIEELAGAWTRRTGGTSVCLRFPWVGSDEEPRRVAGYLRVLLHKPHSVEGRGNLWASVHVDDLADAFIRALDVRDGATHLLNVASPWVPGDLTVSELAALDHPTAERRPGLDSLGTYGTARAQDLLGWQPGRTFAAHVATAV